MSTLMALVPLAADSVPAENSKRAYRRALSAFLAWAQTEHCAFTRANVMRYRSHLGETLGPSAVNQALSAIRTLAREANENGLLGPSAAASIGKIPGLPRRGVRSGNWLDHKTTRELLALPDTETLKGLRDAVILGLLVGCGLRREEAAALDVSQVQTRDGRAVIVDLVGKGGRVRTVPVPWWVHGALDSWLKVAGSNGRVLRSIDKADHIDGTSMTANAIYQIVRDYAERLGVTLAPHDLRRTFAKLARKGAAPIEQIQMALGHASVATTERYLGVALDLESAACDHLGIEPEVKI
jgi:integrase/recombinase XerD